MNEYKVEDIKRAIKSGLGNYQILFKNALKNSEFKKLSTSQRANAGRILVKLADVAKNPDMYFSYKNTKDAWTARMKECMLKSGFKRTGTAYMVADKPETAIQNQIRTLPDYVPWVLICEYNTFIEHVRKWEYATAQGYKTETQKHAKKIIEDVARVSLRAHAVMSPAMLRPVRMALYSMQY